MTEVVSPEPQNSIDSYQGVSQVGHHKPSDSDSPDNNRFQISDTCDPSVIESEPSLIPCSDDLSTSSPDPLSPASDPDRLTQGDDVERKTESDTVPSSEQYEQCIVSDEEQQKFNQRKVKFPDDDFIVTGYLEPHNHWSQAKICTTIELIDAYRHSCERHLVRPVPLLLEQLKGINIQICNDRYDMLSLKGTKLDGRHIETLEEIFKRVQFKTLDFENTNLDDDMAISLFDMIEYYESCTKLNIAMNSRITFRGFQTCSRMMKKSYCLNSLDLRGIIFADIAMPALARSLRVGSNLSVLHLENCNICGRNLLILVSALKMNDSLRELYLSNNKMMTTDGIQLGALLKVNHRLQLLDVRNNSLGDVGVSHLCDGLYEQTGQTGLLTLILWSNSLTHLAMPALAQALKRCRHLQTLNLANNIITSEGAHYLREGLLCNRSLLRISLCGCKITCEGSVALAEYIADTKQLLRMDLRENDIRTGGLMALALALKVNESVTRLDLDRDPKKDPGVKDYMQAQRDLTHQIEEHLRRNRRLASEHAERQLEEEQSQLGEDTNSAESMQRPTSLDLPPPPQEVLPVQEEVQPLDKELVVDTEEDEVAGEVPVSPSPILDNLAQRIHSPTDDALMSPALPLLTLVLPSEPVDAIDPVDPDSSDLDGDHSPSLGVGEPRRVLQMRSEMKRAGSGRTFLVTTTVYDDEPGQGGAASGASTALEVAAAAADGEVVAEASAASLGDQASTELSDSDESSKLSDDTCPPVSEAGGAEEGHEGPHNSPDDQTDSHPLHTEE